MDTHLKYSVLTLICFSLVGYYFYSSGNKNNKYKQIIKNIGKINYEESKEIVQFILNSYNHYDNEFNNFIWLSLIKSDYNLLKLCFDKKIDPNYIRISQWYGTFSLLEMIIIKYYNNIRKKTSRKEKILKYARNQLYFLIYVNANADMKCIIPEIQYILDIANKASKAEYNIIYQIKYGNNPFGILPPIVWFNRLSKDIQKELLIWCNTVKKDILSYKLTFAQTNKIGGIRARKLLEYLIIPDKNKLDIINHINIYKYAKSGTHLISSFNGYDIKI
jgi:hypothetical protein